MSIGSGMSSSPIDSLFHWLKQRRNINCGFVPGSSASWLISLIEARNNQRILVLADSSERAEEIIQEIRTFSQAVSGLFPALEYFQPDGMEASQERVGALARILTGQVRILVAPAISLFQPTISQAVLRQYLFELKPGENLDLEQFLGRLIESGYQFSDRVSEQGEISRRGGIVDIFPPLTGFPVRVELFGERIESIRAFDPGSQISRESLSEARICPAREFILTKETSEALKKAIFSLADDLRKSHLDKPEISYISALQEIMNHLETGSHFYGEERFLGLLKERESILDYLGEEWLIAIIEPWAVNQALRSAVNKYNQDWSRLVSGGSLLPRLEQIFFQASELEKKLFGFQILSLGSHVRGREEEANLSQSPELELCVEEREAKELELALEQNPDLSFSARLTEPISRLLTELKKQRVEKFSTILVCSSLSQCERIGDLLREQGLFPAEMESKSEFYEPKWNLTIALGELGSGFRVPELGLALISEREIFGEKIRKKTIPAERVDWREEDLSDLEPGELVVHIKHGIGIYKGMCQVKVYSFEKWDYLKEREKPKSFQPCLEIEYAQGARLYLPVDQINQIQKYRASGDSPPKLDRLGGKSFELAKKKALEAIEKLAEDLLDIYASREVFPGYAFPLPDHTYREFEASFGYEETPDQRIAIERVIGDLSREKPMDRLVLGDVGYGKTEVGLRAAFLVAMNGKQVAMLCPTTLLAQQHYDNFRERLKDWPLEVGMLSRFQSRAQQKKLIERIKSGLCDIVIGTHRLLSEDVEFADLGLLIIDEEQRFGVAQKEKIKKLKKMVHCLTLSATPIPRTLEMGLLGLRDLSMINTPPPDRQAIHTELIHLDHQLIREAILREMQRGGQVFFVHNRVQGIEQIGRWLSRLVPEARVAIAHGQMDEQKLEEVMHNFYLHKYDVLVSTAIIESGLDIPSANTMFINRAEQFGLAQLYQLRGRIGRSKEKAYAYLIVPSRAGLKGDAVKRLKALKEFTELGSGFKLAAYDLKIRGAGNLLGKEQSGQINRIGYELYLRLLEQKINELKGIKVEEEFEPRIKLAIPAYLPEDYIPSDSERLGWYKRLAMAKDDAELDSLREELMDRYGKIPPEALTLLEAVKLKFQMKELRIPEIEADETKALISFDEQSKIDFERVFSLVQNQPSRFRFTKEQALIYLFNEKANIFKELVKLGEQIKFPG